MDYIQELKRRMSARPTGLRPEPNSARDRANSEASYSRTLRSGGNVRSHFAPAFGDIFSERRNLRNTPYFIGPNPSVSAPFGTRQGEALSRRDAIGDVIAGPSNRLGDPEGYDRPRRLQGGGATDTELTSLGYNPQEFHSRPNFGIRTPSGGYIGGQSRVSGKDMASYFGPGYTSVTPRPTAQQLAAQARARSQDYINPVNPTLPENPFGQPTAPTTNAPAAPQPQQTNFVPPTAAFTGVNPVGIPNDLGVGAVLKGMGQGLFPGLFGFPKGTPGTDELRKKQASAY